MGLNDKPKGLGDTVENVLKNTGIAKVVKYFVKSCNCTKRKHYLNRVIPYKNTEKIPNYGKRAEFKTSMEER